jgi:cytochrome c-type biogenesis protein CcmH/NrfG
MPGAASAAAFLLLCVAWPRTASPAEEAAATLERDFASCRAHANIDACYDALRWKPSDPALLLALGDAQERAQRPADAIRAYKRAAAIAPGLPGISAKISAAEAKMSVKHVRANTVHAEPGKRYSNADPETRSH